MDEDITPETNKPFNCIWSHDFTIFFRILVSKAQKSLSKDKEIQARKAKQPQAFQVGLVVAY